MKKKNLIILLLTVTVVLVFIFKPSASSSSETVIEHLGSSYSIDNKLNDYNARQASKIEGKIRKISPPKVFADYEKLIYFSEKIKVPGYGSSTGGFGDSTSIGRVSYFSVEIPHKNEYRVMVYLQKYSEDEYHLIDDFYTTGDYPPLFTTKEENNTLVYVDDRIQSIIRRKSLSN